MIPASLARRLAPLLFTMATVATMAAVATAAASGQSETPRPAETPKPAAPEVAAPPAPPPPPVLRIPDRGDFKVVYERSKNPDYQGLQQIFKETQLLEETVRALNGTLAMPADVTVSLRECGTP